MTPDDQIEHMEAQISEIAKKLMSEYPHENISEQFRRKICDFLRELCSEGSVYHFSVCKDPRQAYRLRITIEVMHMYPYCLTLDTRYLQEDLYNDNGICFNIV